MGWLKVLCEARKVGGFDALAKAVLADARTPRAFKKNYGGKRPERSLGNRLRGLDAGSDAKLLDEIGTVLALRLGFSVDELRGRLREAVASRLPHVVELGDLGGGLPLDLVKEDLPPGIPREVQTPEKWARVWWVGPSGAGKNLTGRWLAARGLAQVVEKKTWREVALPKHGPVFVILDEPCVVPASEVREGVCVAARFRPSDSSAERKDRSAWHVVTAPPIADWLGALLGWVHPRLKPDSGFDADAVRSLIEREGVFETLGDVLALCGLADRVEPEELRRGGVRGLARHYMEVAVGRAPAMDPKLRRELQQHAADLIVALCRGLLCRVDSDPDLGLPLEAFEPLLPATFEKLADIEGARALLSSGTNDAKELAEKFDKLREKIGPSTPAVASTLRDIRLLEPHGKGYRMKPWIRRLATPEAVRAVVEAGGSELGEALIRPHAAPAVLDALLARLLAGDTNLLEKSLKLDFTDPAGVAAFEGCFRAAGIAVLRRASVPLRLLRRAWERQFTLAVARFGNYPPVPMIAWAVDHPWLSLGTWSLACLAISERIEAREPAEFSWACPPAPGLAQVLAQACGSAWERDDRPEWWPDAFELGGRLLKRGIVPPGEVPDLLVPAAVVRAAQSDGALPAGVDVTWAAGKEVENPAPETAPEHAKEAARTLNLDVRWLFTRTRSWLPPLRDQATRAGIDFGAVIATLWRAWAKEGDKSDLHFDGLGEEDRREIWRHVPADLCGGPLFKFVLDWHDVPRDVLSAEHWRAFLFSPRWKPERHASPTRPLRAMVWLNVPEDVALEAVRRGLLGSPDAHEARQILWERFPRAMEDLALAGLDAEDVSAIFAAPAEHRERLLAPLRERLKTRGPSPLMARRLRSWLHDHVSSRLAGWRTAFAMLQELAAPRAARRKDRKG